MAEAVGIDIGSSYTRIACHRGDPNQTPIEVIQNQNGDLDVPAVVANNNGKLIAGRDALLFSKRPENEDNSIYKVKCLLSTKTLPKSTKKIKRLTRNSSISLLTQSDRMPSKVSFGSDTYTPSQLLDPLLAIHVDSFRRRKSVNPTRCTIAVPAHFGKEERMAVEASAKRVGFQTVTIINESTAAVVQYQYEFKTGDGRYLVFNCSAVGCDATIVEVRQGQYLTKGMAILQGFSGDDLDQAICNMIIKRSGVDKDTIREDKFSMDSINSAIQDQKPKLVKNNSVHFFTSTLKDGNPIDLELHSTAIESETDDLLENFTRPITDLIRHQGIDPEPENIAEYINHFVIIGGTSQIPFYRNKIIEVCGLDEDDVKYVDPKTSVATGAAFFDELLLKRLRFVDMTVGVKPILYVQGSICVSEADGEIQELYDTIIPYPDKKAFRFQTKRSNQKRAIFNFTFKESKNTEKLSSLGSLTLDNIPSTGSQTQLRLVIEIVSPKEIKVKAQAKGTNILTQSTFSIPDY